MSSCSCQFCHLHVHSEYSLLDGSASVRKLAERAAGFNQPALALTDHGVMFGAIEHYAACTAVGIKPIVGMEAYVAPRSHRDKDPHLDSQKNTRHLTLWAKNLTGYKNLVQLSTKAHLDGFYFKPRIDHELLAQYSEGIIGASACLKGEIPQFIKQHEIAQAAHRAEFYQELFGKDNFYLELMDHGLPEQRALNEVLYNIHDKTGIPVLATNDVHFLRQEDERAHKVLVCIGTNSSLNTSSLHYGPDFYFKSSEEMTARFKDFSGATENTIKIADQVDLSIDLKTTHFPAFKLPDGMTSEAEYLTRLCQERFSSRYADSEAARTRLNYELSIIISKSYAGYFLVVQDIITWAKARGIFVGCRGSAAGCLVSYVLGITNIDPIRYKLLFERFLNPDRISTPDIDMDFPDQRRAEVLAYVNGKYGYHNVAQIITFGTLQTRAAVRDSGRVLEIPYALTDQVAKACGSGSDTSVKEEVAKDAELKRAYQTDSQIQNLCNTAAEIEGTIRHATRHACGVVIAPWPLDDMIPLIERKGEILTQYGAGSLEKLGLVKMDFLSINTNTLLTNCLKLIQDRHGITLDLETIPLDDTETYRMISKGDVLGVFQLETSAGMKQLIMQLQPDRLEHIIAAIALYRPGPMEEIPKYVAGRHGGKVEYLHPKLKEILSETYGMMLYQEQVMQACQILAGFTPGQSESLMKAMGKKKHDVMDALKPQFIEGCIANGESKRTAEHIFGKMETFSSYAFNKSHSAYYGLVGYWTAYLKCHYPLEFLTCKLSVSQGNKVKILRVIDDCRHHAIKVLPPDINESTSDFTIAGDSIRFGFYSLKGLGEKPIEAILRAREAGRFVSIWDFCRRVTQRDCPKSALEILVQSGSFDSLHKNRSALLSVIPVAIERSSKIRNDLASGQIGMFAQEEDARNYDETLPMIPDTDRETRLKWERELVGIYVSDHPLLPWRQLLEEHTTPLDKLLPDTEITVGGVISQIKVKTNKKNQEWARFTIEDLNGTVEVTAFGGIYQKYRSLLKEDNLVVIQGKVESDQPDGEEAEPTLKLIAQEVRALASLIKTESKPTYTKGFADPIDIKAAHGAQVTVSNDKYYRREVIHLKDHAESVRLIERGFHIPLEAQSNHLHIYLSGANYSKSKLQELATLANQHGGDTELWLHLDNGRKTEQLRAAPHCWVKTTPEFLVSLTELVGSDNWQVYIPQPAVPQSLDFEMEEVPLAL